MTSAPVTPPPASVVLTQQGIPHETFRHLKPVHSLEQAAAERGQTAAQVVRSLLFRLGEEEWAMVLVAGPEQVSWKRLRQYLGQSRLTMADRDDVLAVTGYPIGAVGPFGLRTPMRILVDRSVAEQRQISLGSGTRGTAIIMATVDLLQLLDAAEIGDFRASDEDAPTGSKQ